ncbi:MAG: tyrosine--tRNA ligase [Candidatus Diapherotrites archaeon]|jgi:tyrosyl-tRNA synthetase|uniref:tyrosine--tRNA ligase n=1 Tax=Candidatus Iainarchaeum sp. TaxID=3101447 RepID=A0A8T5GDR4_9ARCH|nr:tyrosine--tRNA ligase [Candidatus Diapherotrites archaeon]MBT7241224.1 tyrosine--tRNA ligase [Candidatus Diapherotrites archaeon]
MDIEKRMALVKEVGEEILTEEELRTLLETKKNPIAYDGFEPSGQMHIAQGVLRAININKMIDAGFTFKMWVADWFAWANNKLGGNLENIQVAGEYLIEIWKTTGMNLDKVKFVWANDAMGDPEYWKIVMNVATKNSLARITRCSQIMGRTQKDALKASQIFYPCMQCADIFYLNADATQLGMDQRKVNVLAREVGEKLGYYKPVVISNHMIAGLKEVKTESEGAERAIAKKMSKSNPDSAIFMTDTTKDIQRKISKAFCPEKIALENPILEYNKYMVFERFDSVKIERPDKFGGDVLYKTYAEMESDFTTGKLHPMDLKTATASYIDKLIEPTRKHFEKNTKAKDLLEQVQSFQITR